MPEMPELNPDDDFAADIIGISSYAPDDRKKKQFLPWHKPRKQFVRQAQWVVQINKMVDDIMPENNTLKYLGLPGDDLLDLRYFHQHICVPKNLQLKFLGFNRGANPSSSQKAELNISLDEVNKLKLVDPSSDIMGDDICQIANVDSLAWDKSKRMGPYDVINIDLCDGFGKHHPDQFKETHYNTLMQLLTLQARRANPWLLLITTRTGSDHVESDVFQILKNLYLKNLDGNDAFRQSSNTKFSIGDIEGLEKACLSEGGSSNVFLVSLCKWIASIITGQNPPAKMEVKSVLGYKVDINVSHQDLVSLAIRIEPTFEVKPDIIGLAILGNNLSNEGAMAIQALDRISKLGDVDKILADDGVLMKEMISVSSDLLSEARYDIESYADWAIEQ